MFYNAILFCLLSRCSGIVFASLGELCIGKVARLRYGYIEELLQLSLARARDEEYCRK